MSATFEMIRRTSVMLSAALALAVCSMPSLDASAVARDADGGRMQARSIKLGTTQRDTLRPPGDRVDWRSVKLSKQGRLSVSVSHKQKDATIAIRLTDSRGQSKGQASTRNGRGALNAELKPGIYYISVSSKKPVSYAISVR